MIVAVNQGIFETPTEAANAMVQLTDTIRPNLASHEIYNELYQIYLDLYPRIKGLFQVRYKIAKRRNWETQSTTKNS